MSQRAFFRHFSLLILHTRPDKRGWFLDLCCNHKTAHQQKNAVEIMVMICRKKKNESRIWLHFSGFGLMLRGAGERWKWCLVINFVIFYRLEDFFFRVKSRLRSDKLWDLGLHLMGRFYFCSLCYFIACSVFLMNKKISFKSAILPGDYCITVFNLCWS